ncbi:MAG: hypothetical protein IKR04_05870 [Clostridia bacterium]|nr:hypothetical protein [Clostridia bacterium]
MDKRRYLGIISISLIFVITLTCFSLAKTESKPKQFFDKIVSFINLDKYSPEYFEISKWDYVSYEFDDRTPDSKRYEKGKGVASVKDKQFYFDGSTKIEGDTTYTAEFLAFESSEDFKYKTNMPHEYVSDVEYDDFSDIYEYLEFSNDTLLDIDKSKIIALLSFYNNLDNSCFSQTKVKSDNCYVLKLDKEKFKNTFDKTINELSSSTIYKAVLKKEYNYGSTEIMEQNMNNFLNNTDNFDFTMTILSSNNNLDGIKSIDINFNSDNYKFTLNIKSNDNKPLMKTKERTGHFELINRYNGNNQTYTGDLILNNDKVEIVIERTVDEIENSTTYNFDLQNNFVSLKHCVPTERLTIIANSNDSKDFFNSNQIDISLNLEEVDLFRNIEGDLENLDEFFYTDYSIRHGDKYFKYLEVKKVFDELLNNGYEINESTNHIDPVTMNYIVESTNGKGLLDDTSFVIKSGEIEGNKDLVNFDEFSLKITSNDFRPLKSSKSISLMHEDNELVRIIANDKKDILKSSDLTIKTNIINNGLITRYIANDKKSIFNTKNLSCIKEIQINDVYQKLSVNKDKVSLTKKDDNRILNIKISNSKPVNVSSMYKD